MKKISIFLLTGLALSLTSCVGAIDKALYSVTESVTEKDKITGLRSLSFRDRKAQIKYGDSNAKAVIKQYAGNINEKVSRSQYRRLKKIFERVHKISHFRNEKWTVFLTSEKEFNAFAFGGTYLWFWLGLMEFCNDDELAAIIGHEIGHVVANHISEKQAYIQAATLADAKNLKKEGYAEGFNRNQEAEADKIGVLYTALAGYDPQAASNVWVKMKSMDKDSAYMTRTHPMNDQRARNNATYAKQVRQYYTHGKINPDFEKLLVKNVLWDASGKEKRKREKAAGFWLFFQQRLTLQQNTTGQKRKERI